MKKILSHAYMLAIVLGIPFAASAAIFEHDLFYGMVDNSEVKSLQEFLDARDLYDGPVNGNFFLLTKAAVIRFQTNEGITPAEGYFGPKTRARANVLVSPPVSREEQIALLQAQIKALQETIAQLLAQKEQESATSTQEISVSPSPSPFPSPSPSPSPSILSSPSPTPTPSATPVPVVELRITGTSTQPFPDTVISPLKLGDITIANTTDHPVLFSQFVLDIYEAMNSSLNRDKTVLFKLRNGTTTADDLISETKFAINREPPPYGETSNHRQLNVSFPITVASAQTHVSSLWIENLDYVISGSLRIEILETLVSDTVKPKGGFTFILTK